MAEYKPRKLAEVDVVAEPADGANVLIEQDGEIKRAPKTAVGGGVGGGKPVVFYPAEYLSKDPDGTQMATPEEIVEAYFAGNGYVLDRINSDERFAVQKIMGFAISGTYCWVRYMAAFSVQGASMAKINTTTDELNAALSSYLS